jgi:uncharacterized membrane protein YeiB
VDADAPPAAWDRSGRRPSATRLVGVDLARSVAIIGMIVAHTGAPFLTGAAADAVHGLSRGRSSILFAFLAGLSLALVSGRSEPVRGRPGRRIAVKVAARAAVLIAVGTYLSTLDSGVAVILNYYGFFFLFALPLLRLRANTIAAVAVVLAATGPQLSFALRWGFESGALPLAWRDRVDAADPLARAADVGILDVLAYGSYPAFTFLAFLAAGLAVGRLDLTSDRVRWGLFAAGNVLAAVGYGVAEVALRSPALAGRLAALESSVPYTGGGATDAERLLGRMFGEVPVDDTGWLLLASPHSGTSFEILGSTGVALVVLSVCLFLGDRFAGPLYPLAAVGSMSLTLYTAHVLILAWINGGGAPVRALAGIQPEFFVIGALVFATVWRLAFGRGPLERVLGGAASGAATLLVRPRPGEERPRLAERSDAELERDGWRQV